MRLYLDMCCFNRPFDDQSMISIRLETEAKLDIQKNIKTGKYKLVWSYILDYENNANPYIERKTEIQKWKALAKIFINEKPDIISKLPEVESVGIKPLDALHIACAISLHCDFFITVDKGIIKKADEITEIRILNPIDFILNLEAE